MFSSWPWRSKVPCCGEGRVTRTARASGSWGSQCSNYRSWILPAKPPIRLQPWPTPDFSLWNPEQGIQVGHAWTSDLENCEIIHGCCFGGDFVMWPQKIKTAASTVSPLRGFHEHLFPWTAFITVPSTPPLYTVHIYIALCTLHYNILAYIYFHQTLSY